MSYISTRRERQRLSKQVEQRKFIVAYKLIDWLKIIIVVGLNHNER